MKMKKEHYNLIEQGIKNKLAICKTTFQEVVENIIAAKAYVKDPEISAIWYIYHRSTITEDKNGLRFSCDVLYDYLNDNHIETVLKRIVKELK